MIYWQKKSACIYSQLKRCSSSEVAAMIEGVLRHCTEMSVEKHYVDRVLVQTAKGIGDNGIWRLAKLNGILYLPDVGSKTTSFSSAFASIFASN